MSTETKRAKIPVLIVDDEENNIELLERALRSKCVVYTATSGTEAMEIIKSTPEIEAVLTDQRMPGMSGVELMKHARTEFPAAIRIVFTGYADIKAVVEAINAGGLFRYVTKPWDPDALVSMLHLAAQRYEEDRSRLRFAADVRDLAAKVCGNSALRESQEEADRQLIEQAHRLADESSRLFSEDSCGAAAVSGDGND